jgi:hypothetical protein
LDERTTVADDGLKVTLDGKEYALDDFELGELEWLEEELGDLDDMANMASMKAAVRFVYVIKRRDNPGFTLDDARKLKLSVFDEPQTNGNGAKKRPTRAAKAASTPAESGATS